MLYALIIAAEQATPDGPGLLSFLPFILIAVAFYFLMVMPMRRQEKQRQALITAV